MRFWLGTHMPGWLWDERLRGVDLFISRRTLSKVKNPRPALTDWALDSGGFSELSMYGEWRTGVGQYVAEVRRWSSTIGRMEWAAAMDWMCEPFIVEKTGLSVEEHQYRTVANYLELRELAPELPWLPVIQGWTYDDYFRCVEMYGKEGIDLRELPVVGVGSVCRRQDTGMAEDLMRDLRAFGIKPHGFGFKFKGVVRASMHMESADSLAWSFNARKNPPLPGCTHGSCANCYRWALRWRERLMLSIASTKRKPICRLLF